MKSYLDNLIPVNQDKYFKDVWSFPFADSFLQDAPPPLLGTSNQTDGLVPLPQSLSEYHRLSSLPSLYPPISDVSSALVPYNSPHFEDLPLDDVDFDSFHWDDDDINLLQIDDVNVSICNQIPIEPNSLSPPNVTSINLGQLVPCDDEGIVPSADDHERRIRRSLERRGNGRCSSRLNDISFDEIKNYFYMPITRAAKEMNVGLTVLKKRCRELGISRWPHRKMKSLKSLIHNVQELGQGGASEEEGIRSELERLEEHRKLMEENPEMQLTERTKRLRQACFKANYKKRRLMQCPDLGDYPFMIS